nr:Chain B, LYS-LYS-GLU-THR-TRP-VAL peptide ligand [synthetic construct]
KKETWV